jgi:hypothetical protein
LHIGDHDPSGVHVFSSLAEDVEAFSAWYDGDVEFVRVAVTPEQTALYNLRSAPPKPTDNRRFDGDETWQAEALDPRILAEIVTQAIEEADRPGALRSRPRGRAERASASRQGVLSRLRFSEDG